MAHTSDFSKVYTSSSSGLSVGEVATCLIRPGCGLVGMLCADRDSQGNDVGKIDKWAKYKPVRYNSPGILTEANRKSTGYGFGEKIMTGNNSIFTAIDPKGVFNRAVETMCDWEYFKPRGYDESQSRYEWLRLLDFDGYDKNPATAIPPIEVSGGVTAVSLDGGGTYRKLYLTFTIQSQAQIQLLDLLDTSYDINYPERSQWKYCALIRKYGNTGYPTAKFGNAFTVDAITPGSETMTPLFTYTDGIVSGYYHKPSEGPNAIITFPAPYDGDVYEIIPCVTKKYPGQSDSASGATLYLPCGQVFYDAGGNTVTPRAIVTSLSVLRNQSSLSGNIQTGSGSATVKYNLSFRIGAASQIDWTDGGVKISARLYTYHSGQKIYGDFTDYHFNEHTPRDWDVEFSQPYSSITSGDVLTYSNARIALGLPTDPNFTSGNGVYLDLWIDGMPVSNSELDSPIFVPV